MSGGGVTAFEKGAAARPPLQPARLAFTAEGVLYSETYGDVYHAAAGGREQARHVFLAGNDLPRRWQDREIFTVVETGFGIGLNFLETWAALRAAPRGPARLHFVSVEKHPFAAADLAAIHARFPELAPLAAQLDAAWPWLLPGFHRLHFDAGRVTLTLLFGDAASLLPQLDARADAIYLDGFAPAKNPQLWSTAIFRELARLAAPGATIATWTVAAAVRDGLAASGFAVDKQRGYADKREMLVGRKPGTAPARPRTAHHAVVIGAGIAGTTCAERLAERGWHIDVIERRPAPTPETADYPSGLLRPVINLADAPNAQLSRAALGYALRHLAALEAAAPDVVWRASGVLHLAQDAKQAERFARIVAAHGFPPEFVRFVDVAEAAQRAGHQVRGGGWWFPRAAWAEGPRLCGANLARHADRIKPRFGCTTGAIERTSAGWCARDAAGSVIAEAPVIVLACAYETAAFAPGLPLGRVRGQVTYLPPAPARRLDIAVCGEGYIAPRANGGHCVGATFQHDDFDLTLRAADNAENFRGLEAMLPGFGEALDPAALGGRAGLRTTTSDRLPVYGELPGMPGLCCATGLGARGLVWAPLCAEILASRLNGEPLPVEHALVSAIDPDRFPAGRPPSQ